MDRKILLVGLASFLLIGAVAVGVFVTSGPASFRGTAYQAPYPIAPEIELARADGSSFRLSETRGKLTLLFFGYTSCPDVCPTTLAELKQTLEGLGARADRVQVLFVTVDPERDTPQRVQEYLDHFDSRFVGLSGSEPQLAKVWNNYGIFREVAADSTMIDHTARVTVIDQQGNLRLSFLPDTPMQNILHDLKLLLR